MSQLGAGWPAQQEFFLKLLLVLSQPSVFLICKMEPRKLDWLGKKGEGTASAMCSRLCVLRAGEF